MRPPSPALARALAQPGTDRPKRVLGACTACGQCCRIMAVPGAHHRDPVTGRVKVKLPPNPKPDWLNWLRLRGAAFVDGYALVPFREGAPRPAWISFYGTSAGPVTYIANTCTKLTDDNVCTIHDTPELPAMCKTYPLPDDDLSVVPDCGFRIE